MSENYRIKLQEVVNVGGGITPTGTIEITQNGIVNVAPYAEANVQVPGSASGTITITENQQGLDISSYAAANIEVPQGVFPEGTLQISENGEKTVANYEKVDVNVPQGVFPAGTLEINQNGLVNVRNYENANVNIPGPTGTKDITENGDYDVSAFAGAHVAVPQGITPTGTINITQNGDTDVTNYATAHVAVPGGVTPTGSINIDENGTYNVTDKATAIINVPIHRTKVAQSGTWQFKTTPTKGFIILGKDDDPSDSAQYVRMINGYGYPVVLNTEAKDKNSNINSDSDTQYSQYPSGSTAQFPNGCTVEQLNRYIIANNKGEVAQHDDANDGGQIWSSDKLTGDALDAYYTTYTTGGGTKTKTELKDAVMEKYKSTDLAQGASRVDTQRELIEDSVGCYIYTIGTWGGHTDFVIDNITIGTTQAVEVNTNEDGFSRSLNYMGDGQLTDLSSHDPYYIYRHLDGILAANVETDLAKAYNDKRCIELFTHGYIDGTEAKWNNFKDAMDTIKTWVDANKIQVVTRKQYFDLGEFVSNPIVSLSLTPDELSYEVGATITAANFTCKAVLQDTSEVTCEADKVLDISNIDTTTEGTYTAILEYRGFKTTCNVLVSDNPPTNYLLENGSYSGEGLTYNADAADLVESITFEANKNYQLEFDFSGATDVTYASHYIGFKIGGFKANWVTCNEVQLNTVQGTSSGHITIPFSTIAAQTISKLVRVSALAHTTVGAWSITNAYIYEVTE